MCLNQPIIQNNKYSNNNFYLLILKTNPHIQPLILKTQNLKNSNSQSGPAEGAEPKPRIHLPCTELAPQGISFHLHRNLRRRRRRRRERLWEEKFTIGAMQKWLLPGPPPNGHEE